MSQSSIEYKGIGAQLDVNPTKRFEHLLVELGRSGIDVYQPDMLHVTLVDPRDSVIPIYSERDDRALEDVRANVGKFLSGLHLGERVLRPDKPFLLPYGNNRKPKIGISVKNDDFLQETRNEVLAIYRDARIAVQNKMPYSGHIVVGVKSSKFRNLDGPRSPFLHNQYKVPVDIHLSGFSITETSNEVITQNVRPHSQTRGDRRYRNQPGHFRRTI